MIVRISLSSEARCLSLLANVSTLSKRESKANLFGEEVVEILRALGAGSALSAINSLSRPGTAGGDAADGKGDVVLAPFVTEEETHRHCAK